MPSEKGFCLPYGFIANDSGAEDRDMAVTYRMNNHPDVMIVFQDASYQLPYKVPLNSDLTPVKNYDAKDYAKWLWNKVYMLYPGQKRELLPPGWFSIEMDGRKGSGSFLQVTRIDGKKDYGYLAFVRADPKNSTQKPDLQVYVSSYSFLVTKEHPQISPNELKALAEYIVSSVKHR
uniref:T6SS immunity protein Tli4 family protein n=1 Tax=Citrobacter freundii TaxID=546 RepID=UPI0023DDCA8A|nr:MULTISPECIES: T6SS immunity protein Tli4 family protein [Citrobacter]